MTDNNYKIEEIDKPQSLDKTASDTSLQSTENGQHTQQFANSHPNLMPETGNQSDVQPSAAQEQAKEQEEPIKKRVWDLEYLVSKLIKEKNGLSPKIKLLALVKVNSVNSLCVQIEDEIGWYREEDFFTKFREINQCINLQIPPEIDYAKEVDTKLKENKQIKELKQQLDVVITQYENRVIYVQQQLDITETNLHTTTQHYKKIVTDLENRIAEILGQINQMTDISVGIRQNVILASQDELDIVSKTEAMHKIKTLANHLRQFRFEGNDEQSLDYLKIHFLDISHTLSELIRRQGVLLSELHNLDKRWTKKWETLFAEKESEKKEKNEIVEMGRRKIKEFEETIQQLKAQHIKEIQEKDSKIDSLQNELKKHANIDYIRTVLINFLTNPDFSVRETLFNVIATILKFSEDEVEKVKTVWEKEHTSFLKKGSSTVSNWINDRFFSNK